MTTIQDFKALAEQFRKRSWTNDPTDQNYGPHWNQAPSRDDQIVGVVAGSVVARTPVGRVKQQVNIRYSANQIYLDTPSVSAVGPVARLAQRGLAAARLDQPVVVPMPTTQPSFKQPFTVQTPQGALTIKPNPSVHIGRPAELSGRDQVRNMWHLLRGK